VTRRNHRSVRLPGNDYTRGSYFVTLGTHQHEHLFGEVTGERVVLNEFGAIAEEEWLRTAATRPEIELDAFVIMPNHVHGIVILPVTATMAHSAGDASAVRRPRSLGSLVAGYKSAVTVRVNAVRDSPWAPVWQRNYHERLIRDPTELSRIRRYIAANPANWRDDPENVAPAPL
jgi:REP element-mobilizing transposase RayT